MTPIFVCDACGRGFLTAQPHNIDQYPLWAIGSTGEAGMVCGGPIKLRERHARNIKISSPFTTNANP